MKHSTATFCSLAIGLWGYQTGAWAIALPMAIALEARAWIKPRWTLSWEQFKTIHGLAAFLWLICIFKMPLISPTPIPYGAGYHILKCLPVGLFPLVLAQTYCPNVPTLYGAIVQPFLKFKKSPPINLYYPYFGLCLLAASATGGNMVLFLGITALLVAGLLATLRSQRFSLPLFYGLMAVALIVSILGTQQFYWMQANFKFNGPDFVSHVLKTIASSLPQKEQPQRKPPVTIDALDKANQQAKDFAARTAQRVLRSAGETGASQGAGSPAGVPPSQNGTGDLAALPPTLQQGGTPGSGNLGSGGTGTPGSLQSSPQSVTPGNGAIQNAQTNLQAAASAQTEATVPQGSPQPPAAAPPSNNPLGTDPTALNPNPSSADAASWGSDAPIPGLVQQAAGIVDPEKNQTQIGTGSSILPSDDILFRVTPNPDPRSNTVAPTVPFYIKEAAYNQYNQGAWTAIASQFTPKSSQAKAQRWIFGSRTPSTASVRITTTLPQSEGVLKLPVGTSEIDNLTVDSLKVNQYGTVVVQGDPGKLAYTVQFDPTQSLDSPPTPLEREVPSVEQPALQKILQSLSLQGKSNPEILQAIAAFFRKDFQYSLILPQTPPNKTPLSAFLLDHRSGHCEYFASATSLLLRLAGIPTRYVVGYSVQEFSPTEGAYLVRVRNAHAWVTAYVNGAWVTVDNTPPSNLPPPKNTGSAAAEKTAKTKPAPGQSPQAQNAEPQDNPEKAPASPTQPDKPFTERLTDAWSSLRSWIVQHLDIVLWACAIIALGLTIILCSIFFAWRATRKRRSRRSVLVQGLASESSSPATVDGLDSEFYLIENRLRKWGLERKASETVKQWILRLSQKLPQATMNPLHQIIDLHYRYRFDPEGIAPEDRTQLKTMIQSWLAEATR